MPATLGACIVELGRGSVVLEMPSDHRFGRQLGYTHAAAMRATTRAVAPPPAKPDVPAA